MHSCRLVRHASIVIALAFLLSFASLRAFGAESCHKFYHLKHRRHVPTLDDFARLFDLNLNMKPSFPTNPKFAPNYLVSKFGLYLSETAGLVEPSGQNEFLEFQTVN
jgi:hypothetical protein